MAFQNLLYETSEGVATITFNRPETYNSLNTGLLDDLKAALKQIERDASVRAVIITGAGKGFCSGADINEIASDMDVPVTEFLRRGLNVIVPQIRAIEKPFICAVNGVAAGAGASIALACDLRIASENGSFVFAAFANIGLVPDAGATYLLPQLVGVGRTLELIWLADSKERLTAQRALEFGVVNRVVAPDELMSQAKALALKLAQMPTKALGMGKRAVYRASEHNLAEMADYEARLQGAAFKTHDFKEGVTAFIEKRAPVFKGE